MPCCVPGCVTSLNEKTTKFPRCKPLRSRWIAAIQAGTGNSLSPEASLDAKAICNRHFVAKPSRHPLDGESEGEIDYYREPSLFVRDNILFRVASCRLCLRFDSMDNMFNKEHCLVQNYTLQWMATKYFGLFKFVKTRGEEGYFCGSCTVRIDMTHTFWQRITDDNKEYRRLMRMMERAKVSFTNDDTTMENSTPSETNLSEGEVQEDENMDEPTEYTIVKEETQLTEVQQVQDVTINGPALNDQIPMQDEWAITILEDVAVKEEPQPTNFAPTQMVSLPESHVSIIKNEKPVLQCSHCPMQFIQHDEQLLHETTEHGIDHGKPGYPRGSKEDEMVNVKRKTFECDFCNTTFSKMFNLQRHLTRIHWKVDDSDNRCHICNKFYANKHNLKRHMTVHRTAKAYKCKLCQASFRQMQALTDHVNEMHDERQKFLSRLHVHPKGAVKRRRRPAEDNALATRNGGHGRNVPTCNICGQTFLRSKDVVTHFKEVHPDTYLTYHPCSECEEVFFKSQSLLRHRYIHMDTYACPECGKGHYGSADLVRHRHSAHGVQPEESYYVNCPVCKKRFIRNNNYKIHLRSHDGEKKFNCDMCDKSFQEPRYLHIHQMRLHSGEKPYVCAECGAAFPVQSSLTKHKRICLSKPEGTN